AVSLRTLLELEERLTLRLRTVHEKYPVSGAPPSRALERDVVMTALEHRRGVMKVPGKAARRREAGHVFLGADGDALAHVRHRVLVHPVFAVECVLVRRRQRVVASVELVAGEPGAELFAEDLLR